MVKIRIGVAELEMKGHARADRVNDNDLVCCALSMLTETLSRYMEMCKEYGYLRTLEQKIEPGDSFIRAIPYGWAASKVITAFEVIKYGIRALAEEYPENIRLEEED